MQRLSWPQLFKCSIYYPPGKPLSGGGEYKGNQLCYPLDKDSSSGKHYPPFQQLGADVYLCFLQEVPRISLAIMLRSLSSQGRRVKGSLAPGSALGEKGERNWRA